MRCLRAIGSALVTSAALISAAHANTRLVSVSGEQALALARGLVAIESQFADGVTPDRLEAVLGGREESLLSLQRQRIQCERADPARPALCGTDLRSTPASGDEIEKLFAVLEGLHLFGAWTDTHGVRHVHADSAACLVLPISSNRGQASVSCQIAQREPI